MYICLWCSVHLDHFTSNYDEMERLPMAHAIDSYWDVTPAVPLYVAILFTRFMDGVVNVKSEKSCQS